MVNKSPTSLRIRDVTDDDMQAVQRIYAEEVLTGVSSWEEEPPSLNEMLQRRDRIVSAGYPFRVGALDGVVVAYTYAASYRLRPAYRYTVENTIYVDESARGLGIGSQLLSDLIKCCEAKGYRQMIAVIGDSNNQASIDFHARMGFSSVGKINSIGFKFGRWMDSVIMQLALAQGDKTPPES